MYKKKKYNTSFTSKYSILTEVRKQIHMQNHLLLQTPYITTSHLNKSKPLMFIDTVFDKIRLKETLINVKKVIV